MMIRDTTALTLEARLHPREAVNRVRKRRALRDSRKTPTTLILASVGDARVDDGCGVGALG